MMARKDIIFTVKTMPEVIKEYNITFYPGGIPDKEKDLVLYDLYIGGANKAQQQAADEHEKRKEYYESNKNALRSMALGQCDQGIISIIKQQPQYKNNKSNLFWILKEIVGASRKRGHSTHTLYPDLLDLLLDTCHVYQNQQSFNAYYLGHDDVGRQGSYDKN